MAALTGTNTTLGRVGIAEDVHDVIYDISPTLTPVMQMAKTLKATNTLHEWQVHPLAAAALNAKLEGDDGTFASLTPTTRLGNRTMISSKTVMVSRTADTVKKYGRSDETNYNVARAAQELKRDIELALLGQQGSSAGNGSSTPRQAAGYRAMVTNFRRASGTATTGGSVGGFSTDWATAVDSTASTLVQADIIDAIDQAWQDGGNPDFIVVNSKQKQRIGAMTGGAGFDGYGITQGKRSQGAVVAAVDIFVSDAGAHKVIMDRFLGQTSVLCLDSEYIGIAWLDRIKIEELAKTGDARKKLVVCEWTAVMQNPDAHGQVIGCLAT